MPNHIVLDHEGDMTSINKQMYGTLHINFTPNGPMQTDQREGQRPLGVDDPASGVTLADVQVFPKYQKV